MINQVVEETDPASAPAAHTTVIVRQAQPMPNDYFIFALFVTVYCCLPCGVVSLIKSTNVKSRYKSGDIAGAEQASKSAARWAKAALISGIVFYLLFIIAIIVYFTVFFKAVSSALTFAGWE